MKRTLLLVLGTFILSLPCYSEPEDTTYSTLGTTGGIRWVVTTWLKGTRHFMLAKDKNTKAMSITHYTFTYQEHNTNACLGGFIRTTANLSKATSRTADVRWVNNADPVCVSFDKHMKDFDKEVYIPFDPTSWAFDN